MQFKKQKEDQPGGKEKDIIVGLGRIGEQAPPALPPKPKSAVLKTKCKLKFLVFLLGFL
jgi:hypothetical protein